MSVTVIPGRQVDVEIPEEQTSVNVLPESVEIDVEVSQPAPELTVKYGHDAVNLLMSEISLTIRDYSFIKRLDDAFLLIDEHYNIIMTEYHILAEKVIHIQGELDDPDTGNRALADALWKLGIDITNHEGDMDAHAYLFNALSVKIDDNARNVKINADAIRSLDARVTSNRDGWTAVASDVTNLNVSFQDLDTKVSANASSISSNLIRIKANEDAITIYGENIDTLTGLYNDAANDIAATALAVDGIKTLITDDKNGLTASADRITELQVGISNSLNVAIAWEFNKDVEGWQAGDGAEISQSDDALIIDCTYAAGYAYVELDSPIDGATYPYVAVRWKRLTGSDWDGGIYYKYDGTSTWVLAEKLAEPKDQIDFKTSLLDLRATGWADRQITAIAIKFSNLENNSFAVDSVGLGRIGALGPYAYIKDNLHVWVGEDTALASRVTDLEASIGEVHGLIEEEASIRAQADGHIEGHYTISVDLNGYVVGFGLVASDVGDGPTSNFVVAADHFAMVLPGVQDDPVYPFEAGTFHNRPGMVIANAFIGDTLQSENFDDRHGWQIKIAGDGEGQAIFSDITIRDPQGNTILNSGEGLRWENITGANRPADGATRNFIYRCDNPPTGAMVGDLWFQTGLGVHRGTLYRKTGYGWEPIGTYVTHTSTLTDDANLGQTANWDQVWGANKPADNADVTAQNQAQSIVNQGIFATLDRITKDNIYTYIDEAVIDTAFIADLAVGHAQIAELSVGTTKINYSAVSNTVTTFSSTEWHIPPNIIKELIGLTIYSQEDFRNFHVTCSAVVKMPHVRVNIMGPEEHGPFNIAWGVKDDQGNWVYMTPIMQKYSGSDFEYSDSFTISFSFSYIPSYQGNVSLGFYISYSVLNSDTYSFLTNMSVLNRSITIMELKR